MNIVITNVSIVKFTKENKTVTYKYKDEENNEFEGHMTNEAPIESVIKRLHDAHYQLDKIIYIESDTIREREARIDNLTSAEYLRSLINRYCEENGYQIPEYDEMTDSVRISNEPNAREVSESVFKVYNRVVQLSRENDEVNIFVESNGGVRYVLTMLLSVTKTLEMRLDNVHIKEISSMVYNDGTTFIKNTKPIYDTTQIVGIIDEYINYGRVNSLRNYVESLFEKVKNREMINDVNNIISRLSQLSDDIQLCRTTKMLEDFYLDGGIGVVIQEFLKKYSDDAESAIVIFRYLLNVVYSEYKGVIYDGNENYEDTILNLPRVIEWCVKKNFMQQALTLCSEKIPQYLFASGRIELSEKFAELLDKADTKRYERCYYFVANLTNPFRIYLNAPKINYILDEIKRLDNGKRLSLSDEKWGSVYEKTELKCETRDEKLLSYARQICKISEYYMRIKQISDKSIKEMFGKYEIPEEVLNNRVKVSNKYSCTVMTALKNSDNKDSLAKKSTRMILILPRLIEWLMKEDNTNEYDSIVEEVFSEETEELVNALKRKYSQTQSEKFYIRSVLRTGHVKTNVSADELQRIMYLYSLCKEQRNLSNHANVSEDDREVALNSYQLSVLIRYMLKMC